MSHPCWPPSPARILNQKSRPARIPRRFKTVENRSNGKDRVTKNIYDNGDQVIQIRKAVGTSLEQAYATYSYTSNGKLQYVIDANGNKAKMEYDGFDRQTKWILPSKTRPSSFNPASQSTALSTSSAINTSDYEQYTYDANGNRLSLRKRDGQVINYGYDNLNRVTTKSGTTTNNVNYTYDVTGLQLTAKFSSNSRGITNTYDGFGRLKSSSSNMGGTARTVSYQYDAQGNRIRVTYPDGQYVTYEYDAGSAPTAIKRSGSATIASYTYDSAGRRDGFNGGFSTSYSYDGIGRLDTLTNNLPASGNNNQWTFFRNPASQITQITRSNDAFAYTGRYNVSRSYTTNGLNQYTAAGGASFAYDNNGNLTSDGSTTFAYDSENRLTSASGGATATLSYDPLGRLWQVSGGNGTTRFVYDGDALLAEYNTSGTVLRRYVHGADLKADDPIAWYEGSAFSATTERLLRPDWQGSIVAIANSGATSMIAINTYDEYGIPGAGNNTTERFQYTGQAWIPELGMYYYKARMYSPTLGRFMQTDPIGYQDQVNLYAYVANDPINGADFMGLCDTGSKIPGAAIGCKTLDGFGTDPTYGTDDGTKMLNSERIDATDSDGNSNSNLLQERTAVYAQSAINLTEASGFKREHAVTVALDPEADQFVIQLFEGPKGSIISPGYANPAIASGHKLLLAAHTHTGIGIPPGHGSPFNDAAAFFGHGRKAVLSGPSPGDRSFANNIRQKHSNAQLTVLYQKFIATGLSPWIAEGF